MQTFRPFSPTHALVVASFAATALAAVWLRRRWRDAPPPPRGAGLDRLLAAIAGAVALLAIGWPLLPRHFDPAWSLPLHACDLTVLAVPLALLTRRRWPRAFVYFWGLGLSSQSFITPDLRDGPARIGFWVFWLTHFTIVGMPIFDVAARGFRPTWREWAGVATFSLAYAAFLLPLDAATGWNYGYLGPSRLNQPTLANALGPWPLRAVWIVLLAIAAMVVLMLPWEASRRIRNTGRGIKAAAPADEKGWKSFRRS